MMIYVNGQDIARLVLGIIKENTWAQEPQVFEIRPEQYLQGLDAYLREQGIAQDQISGFALVKGPGSATSLRTSHAMINALAFALGVGVTSLEKPVDIPDREAVDLLASKQSHPFALPVYAHEPNITQSRRDALKRKTT